MARLPRTVWRVTLVTSCLLLCCTQSLLCISSENESKHSTLMHSINDEDAYDTTWYLTINMEPGPKEYSPENSLSSQSLEYSPESLSMAGNALEYPPFPPFPGDEIDDPVVEEASQIEEIMIEEREEKETPILPLTPTPTLTPNPNANPTPVSLIPVMEFEDAKRALETVLSSSKYKIPIKVSWPGKAALLGVRNPSNEALRKLWAMLLQTAHYGMMCTYEYRTLRGMERGTVKLGTTEQIQKLRKRGRECLRVMTVFINQSVPRLKKEFQGESKQKADLVMELLVSMSHLSNALSCRIERVTSLLDLNVNKSAYTSQQVAEAKAAAARSYEEYAKIKQRAITAVQTCERHKMLPRVCSIINLV